jgi:catalase (peroxidase I)
LLKGDTIVLEATCCGSEQASSAAGTDVAQPHSVAPAKGSNQQADIAGRSVPPAISAFNNYFLKNPPLNFYEFKQCNAAHLQLLTAPGITKLLRKKKCPGAMNWFVFSENNGGPVGFAKDRTVWLYDMDFGQIVQLASGFEDYLLKWCFHTRTVEDYPAGGTTGARG